MLTSTDLIKIDEIVMKRIELSVEKSIKKHLELFEKKLTKKLNLLITYFENEFSSLKNRVNIIEKHIGLN